MFGNQTIPREEAQNQSEQKKIEYIYIFIHSYIHTFIHSYIHTFIYAYIHIFIYIKNKVKKNKILDPALFFPTKPEII